MREKEYMEFKYVFPDDYNPVYANGAWGGYTTKGEFVINFFQERGPIPKSITYEIEEGNRIGKEIKRKPSDHENLTIRYITTGITLNYVDAKTIHSWLGDMLRKFESESGLDESGKENAQ